jgi:polyhydroxyalkanoate synthesis regulator phasin
MTLIIKQVVIRGEVLSDSGKYVQDSGLSYEKVKELISKAKKEIEQEYQEKISEMIENTSVR